MHVGIELLLLESGMKGHFIHWVIIGSYMLILFGDAYFTGSKKPQLISTNICKQNDVL